MQKKKTIRKRPRLNKETRSKKRMNKTKRTTRGTKKRINKKRVVGGNDHCPICLEAKDQVIIKPCGHTICMSCLSRLHHEICPLCRGKIVSLVKMEKGADGKSIETIVWPPKNNEEENKRKFRKSLEDIFLDEDGQMIYLNDENEGTLYSFLHSIAEYGKMYNIQDRHVRELYENEDLDDYEEFERRFYDYDPSDLVEIIESITYDWGLPQNEHD